ncbi:MAG: hypothetical protein U9N36_08695 [Euryarchaeota archaeon]|nr:hypothetical protein [Euryarchaeota archaeon]
MKTSIRTIGVALLVLSAFVGFAAADESEPPDAGSTWDTARSFDAPVGYTFLDGTLDCPSDCVDVWVTYTPDVGNTLHVYLDSGAYNNYVASELFNGADPHFLMQRVKKGDTVHNTATLGARPAYVNVSASPGDGDYTTVLQREV